MNKKKIIELFHIRKEERRAFWGSLFVFALLNVLNVVANFPRLSTITPNNEHDCLKYWHIAGFDPITYSVMTNWNSEYNVFRHPLLAYFVWPFTKLNELLMALTGYNCAVIITAVLLVFFATYSFIFLSRIFVEIIGTTRKEAFLLSTLNFSFAYVMLSMIVPDHFGPSMFCLVLALYISGKMLQKGMMLNWWQTAIMFFFTAGISLNNGLKIFLAALFTRRKRFFKPGYLIIAVLLPSALMWGTARLTQNYIIWPKKLAAREKAKEKREAQVLRLQSCAISCIDTDDTARIAFVRDSVRRAYEEKRQKRKENLTWFKNTGKPMMQGEFMKWTDVSTNRWDVAVECLFGEGIMLHQDYLLGDVLLNRPVIVKYRNWFNYIIEGILVLLFLGGIWYGAIRHAQDKQKSLFMWTALSFLGLDMALHEGLGFGINEISIMSAHYLYVLPICMAYLLVGLNGKWRKRLAASIGIISAYLVLWNVTLLVEYLYFD